MTQCTACGEREARYATISRGTDDPQNHLCGDCVQMKERGLIRRPVVERALNAFGDILWEETGYDREIWDYWCDFRSRVLAIGTGGCGIAGYPGHEGAQGSTGDNS